jgi:serine/threonine protein kinase
MNTTRWKQIEEIFAHATALDAEDKERYLSSVCAKDPSLREEIESLISSHEEDSPFMKKPILDVGLHLMATEGGIVSLGERVAQYTIVSRLGSGGMGVVYLAIDSRLGRKVAIKFLSSTAIEDLNPSQRFRQEARSASKISHPNVAAIYEIGLFEGKQFIAMEFVDGVTLREQLNQQRPSLNEAIDIAIQLGLAIESAHALGIVHRDIKPENIMIRRDGYVKVLDFGLAKLTEAYHRNAVQMSRTEASTITGALHTQPGLLMGTAAYMSPEQARGLDTDAGTDIWSWGVLLYEMVSGEAPFQGATTSDLLADILRGEPVLLSSDELHLLPALKNVLRLALTKDKQYRYSTITDAISDLRSIKKQLEVAELNAPKVERDRVVHSTLSTKAGQQTETGQSNVAGATDSHVIADNFSTVVVNRLRSISEKVSWKSHSSFAPVLAVLITVGVVLLAVVAIKQFRPGTVSQPHLEFTKLSSEENVSETVISPDGKYIALIVDEGGLKSLWVRQTNTAANLRLIAPTSLDLDGLTFSVDGDSVYFLQERDGEWTLNSVPVLGGEPRKLSEKVESPVTFSPDGHRMAFIRQGSEESTVLTLARSDGTEETTLLELKGPEKFVLDLQNSTGPAWSPDGKVIAVPTINDKESSRTDVVTVQVPDGAMKRVNNTKGFFARVRRLMWLADGNNLIMTANVQHTGPYQIWTLSCVNGETQNLTNDADAYVGLSITRDGGTLVTTKYSIVSSLWIADRSSQLHQIPSTNHNGTNGITWTPDGRVVYARNVAGSCDLWVMNSDGSSRKQLTFDGQRNLAPAVSPDGRGLVFVSYREGRPHLWTVSTDGTGLKQLTDGAYEDTPIVSQDSKWVIYHRLKPSGLWKVSSEGGEPILLTAGPASFPDISPDGQHLAFLRESKKPDSPWRLSVTSPNRASPTFDFDMHPGFAPSVPGLRWSADGSKITYVISVNGVANIWGQPIQGGPPEQLTKFTEGTIFYFAWSKDGQLACARGNSTRELFLVRRVQ